VTASALALLVFGPTGIAPVTHVPTALAAETLTAPVGPSEATPGTVEALNAQLAVASTDMSQNTTLTPTPPTVVDSSVTVAVPDTVVNDATYKEQAINANPTTYAAVTTAEELSAAYADNTITYIDIQGPITFPHSLAMKRNASVIIQGNGNTISLTGAGSDGFFGTNDNWPEGSYVTVNNLDITYDATVNSDTFFGDQGDNGTTAELTWNFNNVSVNADNDTTGYLYTRLVASDYNLTTFSGDNYFELGAEIGQFGAVYVANGATVESVKPTGASDYSMFFFEDATNDAMLAGSVPEREMIVGDGATITGDAAKNTSSYGMLYSNYDVLKVGDNATWNSNAYLFMIDARGSANKVIDFGKNFTQIATGLTGANAFVNGTSATVTYQDGATVDAIQNNNSPVVSLSADQSVSFTNPDSIHLERRDASGNVGAGPVFANFAGDFTLNASSIELWDGTTSSSAGDTPAKTTQFYTATISGNQMTTTGNGSESISDLSSYREIKVAHATMGTQVFNYVDKAGQTISTVTKDFTTGQLIVADASGTVTQTATFSANPEATYHIGQIVPGLSTELSQTYMPDGYFWAVVNQVPVTAAADAQSGGDNTTTLDDGDINGQLKDTIVPIQNQTLTYNIYVYGEEETVHYQYVNSDTGNVVLTDGVTTAGAEVIDDSISDIASVDGTANKGNVINFDDPYYTQTNVPAGYHYDDVKQTSVENNQLVVGTDNPIVTIYVKGNDQTTQVLNEDGHIQELADLTGTTGATANKRYTVSDGYYISNVITDELAGDVVTTAIEDNATVASVTSTYGSDDATNSQVTVETEASKQIRLISIVDDNDNLLKQYVQVSKTGGNFDSQDIAADIPEGYKFVSIEGGALLGTLVQPLGADSTVNGNNVSIDDFSSDNENQVTVVRLTRILVPAAPVITEPTPPTIKTPPTTVAPLPPIVAPAPTQETVVDPIVQTVERVETVQPTPASHQVVYQPVVQREVIKQEVTQENVTQKNTTLPKTGDDDSAVLTTIFGFIVIMLSACLKRFKAGRHEK
jgi:LPXTG-motif cell wall-anchored protein